MDTGLRAALGGAYLKLLRTPGVPPLAGAFLALGTAGTMTPVAFVLFAHAATRSYASASMVLAAATAGGLVFGPARGRLVDRYGARQAVVAMVVPDILTDLAFLIAGHGHAGAPVLVSLGFVAGAVTAPALNALRSVWSEALTDEVRQSGYAVMMMLQETSWIAGPALAGIVIALFSATAAVGATAVLSFAGAVAFAVAAPGGKPADRPPPRGRLPALAGGGIRTVLGTATAFGLTFGTLDVAFPAFGRLHGSAAASGILLSAFAVGSFGGGFLYGLRPRSASAGARYPQLCLLAALGMAPLVLMPPLLAMIALAVLAGLCFAPITTSQMAIVEEITAPAHRAEAFSWLGTLYGAGVAAGAALAGQLIAAASLRAALAAACVATALGGAIALARRASLRHA